jgi:phage gp46-like protein
MNIEHLRKRIHTRLATERGSFVWNPSIGSRLFELTRAKNTADVHDLAQGYIREALAPELRKGYLLSISKVRVLSKTLHVVVMEVDVMANNRQILTFPLELS